eukprot:scaffold2437_cov395-Prasinococcus_capsulatus_cf.AAC.5
MPKSSREKKYKDPNAPKRPRAPYMFFCQAQREVIKAEHPDITFGEVRPVLADFLARGGVLSARRKRRSTQSKLYVLAEPMKSYGISWDCEAERLAEPSMLLEQEADKARYEKEMKAYKRY